MKNEGIKNACIVDKGFEIIWLEITKAKII